MRTTAATAAAGLAATAPMTLAMIAMHRRLPPRLRYPLPPRLITEELGERSGLAEGADEPEMRTATIAAHFAYGAAAGAAYGLLPGALRRAGAATGVAFGLAVWAVSYQRLMPALHILPPATRQPASRNALMIAAHVVWGAALGTLAQRLVRRRG